MFGRYIKKSLVVSAILLGFCVYIIRLYLRNDINLYIHPRYSSFAVIMCSLSVMILLIGTFADLKKRIKPGRIHLNMQFLDVIVVVVLVLAFVLPSEALSSKAVGRKSVNTPSYDAQSHKNIHTTCPETKPESIEVWVYEISQYPINCYKGQSIELTGFVFENPESPLPSNMYYLGRIVMSCCVIDARPYALPIKTGTFATYPDKTWLKVSGKLQPADVHGAIQLVIEPDTVTKVDGPNQPYDYINTPSESGIQPVQPL
jgi:putative membrane protein